MSRKQIGLICVIGICASFLFLSTIETSSEMPHSKLNLHPDLVPILILHNAQDGYGAKTLHEFTHDHSFLIIKKEQRFLFLQSLDELLPYDTDRDNIIDQSDPVYEQLYVGNYDHLNHHFVYQPLCNTAIRAIKIIPDIRHHKLEKAEVMIPTQHQNNQNFQLIITQAIFKDHQFHKLNNPKNISIIPKSS